MGATSRRTPEESANFSNRDLLIAAVVGVVATPVLADDVGVHVGPVGAGVTLGEPHDHDRDRDRNTVVNEREPSDRTTMIKKEDAYQDRNTPRQ
jgi:hypothetical protein